MRARDLAWRLVLFGNRALMLAEVAVLAVWSGDRGRRLRSVVSADLDRRLGLERRRDPAFLRWAGESRNLRRAVAAVNWVLCRGRDPADCARLCGEDVRKGRRT